jgi:cobalamin biosynthesis protein CobT
MLKDEASRFADMLMKSGSDVPYLIYTTEGDRFAYPDLPRGGMSELKERLHRLKQETASQYGVVKRQLQNLLKSRSHSYYVGNLEEGPSLDQANLYQLAAGTSDRVFQDIIKAQTLVDTTATLLIDSSGSMRGSPAQLAQKTAYVFAECLDAIKIPFEVLSFTTNDYRTEHERYCEATAEEQKLYSRFGDVWIHVHKEYDDPWRPNAARITQICDHAAHNIDGEAVRAAVERLQMRPKQRKVLFVLSDGYPEAGSVAEVQQKQTKYLHDVVQQSRIQGVEVVGIGIQSESVKQFYKPQCIVVNQLNDLPRVVLSQLRDILMPKQVG